MKKWRVFLIALAVIGILALGCGVKQILVRENGFDAADIAILRLADANDTQTIDNVTVKAEPISMGADELVTIVKTTWNKPGFCGFGNKQYTKEKLISSLQDKGPWPIFKVTIINKTDHVISFGSGNQMEGSSAVLAFVPEGGNPLMPAMGMGDMAGGAPAPRPGDIGHRRQREEVDQVQEDAAEHQAVVAKLAEFAKTHPALNVNFKVLPGYQNVGAVAFDYDMLKGGDNGEFRIFDLATQVDATGKATKKATFTWKYKILKGKATGLAGALGPTANSFKTEGEE